MDTMLPPTFRDLAPTLRDFWPAVRHVYFTWDQFERGMMECTFRYQDEWLLIIRKNPHESRLRRDYVWDGHVAAGWQARTGRFDAETFWRSTMPSNCRPPTDEAMRQQVKGALRIGGLFDWVAQRGPLIIGGGDHPSDPARPRSLSVTHWTAPLERVVRHLNRDATSLEIAGIMATNMPQIEGRLITFLDYPPILIPESNGPLVYAVHFTGEWVPR